MRETTTNHQCTECGAYLPHVPHGNDCSWWQEQPRHDPQAAAAIEKVNERWSQEMQQLVRPGVKPGLVQRATWWSLGHLGLVFTVSLVGWLLFLAVLGLMLLPGCSDPSVEHRESEAFSSVERFIVHEAGLLHGGTITPETFVREVHEVLEALHQGEAGERSNSAGNSLLELLYSALGGGSVVGVGLNMLRNRTRKRDLADVSARIDEIEKGGGA